MTTNVYLERDKKFREWELLYVNMFEIGILEILYKFGGNWLNFILSFVPRSSKGII